MPVKDRYIRGKGLYTHFYPPGFSYDKALELKPETSEYYAHCVKAYGQAMADYYWNRRYDYEKWININGEVTTWTKECKDIIAKCDIFLKRRGVDTNNIWTINNYHGKED